MFNQFIIKTETDPIQPQSITLQWKLPTSNEIPTTAFNEEEVSGGVAQLTEEETKLRIEKRQLIQIMDELENMLTHEIKTRKASITTLKVEVSELRNSCEQLANALNIPVLK